MIRPLLALLLLAAPAAAQTLRDPASGIAVTAPAGTVATQAPAAEPGPVRPVFDIRRPGETETGCRVATVDSPGNAFLTQYELNARAGAPDYQQAMAAELSNAYDLLDMGVLPHRGLAALVVIGEVRRPRDDPGPPARALIVFLDTPLQRVVLLCVADRNAFDRRLPEFEAVLGGIELN